jgi:hypothetical protein
MGTSKSFDELGDKMNLAAQNIRDARREGFQIAERRLKPKFLSQARAAAGADRRLSGAPQRGELDADFKIIDGFTSTILFVNPVGPWGLRDDTDKAGKTRAHTIVAKNAPALQFKDVGGEMIYRISVQHPGSTRSNFWERARDDAFALSTKQIPADAIQALQYALAGSGFKSRM